SVEHLPGERGVGVERLPRPETDDGAEPALLHRHALRATSRSDSVTSTIASRPSTAMCSSGVWMFVIPLARLTHERPRSLKTLASAAPPERSYTTSCP